MRRRVRRDQGAAAVEFALVVPLLLALVFGIINFGLIFATQISLNSAARDAARAGVVQALGGSGMSCSAIAKLARNSGGTIGSSAKDIGVTVTAPDGTTSCSIAAGQATDTPTVSGSASATLCSGSGTLTSPQLVVRLSYAYSSPVPLVPPTSMDLTSVGRFQCEYS